MTLALDDLQVAAAQAVRAWEDSALLEPFSRRIPAFGLEDGYAVMNRLHEHRLSLGWQPVGRKIGFTNTTIWDRYGVHHPIWGWVYDRTLMPEPPGPAQDHVCSLRGLVQPRIEPEIVVSLAQAPAADGSLEDVLACVEWIAHGFEIVQSHYPAWRFSAADSVAFGSLHGRLMLGPRVTPRELGRTPAEVVAALAAFELSLWRREEGGPLDAPSAGGTGWRAVDRGRGSNVLGNPLAAVAHLQRHLAQQSPQQMMQAGEVITTGTLTDAHAVAGGGQWGTTVTGIGLPGLRVRFTEAPAA